jgi:hypothetical protein
MRLIGDIQSWARRQAAPVTVGILGSLVVTALLIWFLAGKPLAGLAFAGFGKPWTILTYPWAYMPFTDLFGILFFVFLCYWMLDMGGTAERELGPVRYALFLAAVTAAPALTVGLGGLIAPSRVVLSGPWLMVSPLIVAWATRRPGTPITFFFLPLTAQWLAWIVVAATVFQYGFGNPLMGVLACSGYGLAYAFAKGLIPGLAYGRRDTTNPRQQRMSRERENAYYDDVRRREKEREERERLRRLFENSLKDE